MNNRECAQIINVINQIPFKEREDVLGRASAFFTKQTAVWECTKIIGTINQIGSKEKDDRLRSKEREDVLKRAFLFFGHATGISFLEIIKAISQIDPKEREDVLGRTSDLFIKKRNRVSEYAEIITAINQVPSKEREDVLKRASAFFTEHTAIWEYTEIIKTINQVPSKERDDVLKRASRFFCPKTRNSNYAKIINEIRKFSKEGLVELLLTKIIEKGDYTKVLHAIDKIPMEDRDDVLEKAVILFKGQISESTWAEIIPAIRQISKGERADVLEKAGAFLTPNDPGVGFDHLIKAISRIAPEERQEILEKASAFFVKTHHPRRMIGVAELIDAIRATYELYRDRDDVFERAPSFFTEAMKEGERADIIRAIGRISREDRNDVLKRASACFKETMKGNDRAQIIDAIRGTPIRSRDAVLEIAPRFFTKTMEGNRYAQIIRALRVIPASRRDAVLEIIWEKMQLAEKEGKLKDNNRADFLEGSINEILPPDERERHALTVRSAPAFEVHNAINVHSALDTGVVPQVRALINERMMGQPLVDRKRIKAFIESYITKNKRLAQFSELQRQELLRNMISSIQWRDLIPIYSFIVKFHKKYLNAWAATFIEDSLTAYDKTNSLSCPQGIDERIVVGLLQFNLLGESSALVSVNRERSEFLANITLSKPEKAIYIAKVLQRNGYQVGQTTPEEAGKIMKKYIEENLPFVNQKEKVATLTEYEEACILDDIIDAVIEDLQSSNSLLLSFLQPQIATASLEGSPASQSYSPLVLLGDVKKETLQETRTIMKDIDRRYAKSLEIDQAKEQAKKEEERRRQENATANQAGPDDYSPPHVSPPASSAAEMSRPMTAEEEAERIRMKEARLKKFAPKAKDSDSEEEVED